MTAAAVRPSWRCLGEPLDVCADRLQLLAEPQRRPTLRDRLDLDEDGHPLLAESSGRVRSLGEAVAMIPTLALTTVRDDIVIRDLGSEAAIRRIAAATLPGAQRSPAARAMLDVLTDVAAA